MHGVVQRPASRAADARQRGDHVEVRWRIRPPAKPTRPAKGKGAQGKRRRQVSGTRNLVEAVMVVVVLAAVAVVAGGMYKLP
jgi:hypothetical protein